MRVPDQWRPKQGQRQIRLIFPLGLISVLTILLIGCGTAGYEKGTCPAWPLAGAEVAEDLNAGMMPASQYPAFWEWMGRVDKLKDQLSEC